MRKLKIIEPVSLDAQGTPARTFELASTTAMSAGVILSWYKVAGA